MAKEIFSKIIKDYNNELEKILEKKAFMSDAKNLLLSMLYKIENSYEDYSKVKVNVCTKKQFVKEILETIEKRCNNIEFIKPTSEEGQKLYNEGLNCNIDKEEGTIKTFQNEKSILDALIILRQKEIKLKPKYNLIDEPVKELLITGNNMNSVEVIRDFNGWSWDISNKELQCIEYNTIYQMLIILIGNKIIDNWVNDRKMEEEGIEKVPNNMILGSKYNENFGITSQEIKNDITDNIEKIRNYFENIYGEELEKKYFEQLQKNIIYVCTKYNNEYRKKILKHIKELKEKLKDMSDKKGYLDKISKEKIEITKKIEEIDKLLNNEEKLKEEYKKRNSVLKNSEKIFSTSHLRLMLEKQRKQYLEDIKNISKIMEPKEYVSIKNKLEEKIAYYEDIGIENQTEETQNRNFAKLEKIFLDCIEVKIKKAENKKEIENLIYEIRYYEIISNQKENKILEKLEEKLIEKACANKALVTFSSDERLNYNILKNIFKTKIIDLDTISFSFQYNKNGILLVKIYDGNIEDSIVQIQITQKVELLVKLNKKIKIWQ